MKRLLSMILLCGIIMGCQDAEEEAVPPEVVEISPADGEILDSASPLTVVFDKPMDPETVKITVGGVEGKVVFDETHTVFAWTLREGLRLPQGPQLVMIDGRNEAGASLRNYSPVVVNVVVRLPEVVEIDPADGERLYPTWSKSPSLYGVLIALVRVVFSKPMAVETVVITVGGVAGDITFDETHTVFTWTQQLRRLCPGGSRQPVIVYGRDKEGNPLVGYQTTVEVAMPDYQPITIASTHPAVSQPVAADVQKILVFFDRPADPSGSTTSVTSETGVKYPIDVIWLGSQAEIIFKTLLAPKTTYTVAFLNLLDGGMCRYRTELEFTFSTE